MLQSFLQLRLVINQRFRPVAKTARRRDSSDPSISPEVNALRLRSRCDCTQIISFQAGGGCVKRETMQRHGSAATQLGVDRRIADQERPRVPKTRCPLNKNRGSRTKEGRGGGGEGVQNLQRAMQSVSRCPLRLCPR